MTPSTPQTRSAVERDRAAGIGRPGGMFTAAVTAAIVFVVGRHYMGPHEPEVVTLTPTPVAPDASAPASPPPPAADAAATSSAAADAASSAEAGALAASTSAPASDAAARTESPSEGAAKPADDTTAAKRDDDSAAAKRDKAAEDAAQANKDLARESWRRNKPEVTAAKGKSSILIPLKGSSADASQKYLKKTHTLVITLPKAASLNTLHFYKLNRDGFSVLWTDQAETNAKAEDGTKLRLVFAHHAVPDVEIRDEFVRITIAHPVATKSPPAEKPEPREEPASEDKEKDKSKEKDAD